MSGNGTEANGEGALPALSGDGRFVAFTSAANDLVAGDDNDVPDVFVHDNRTGATERVSVASNGSEADGLSNQAAISLDGRYVAFVSAATNLVPGDTNGTPDVFVRDRVAGTTTRVSIMPDGTQDVVDAGSPSITFGPYGVAAISADGNIVALSGDCNGSWAGRLAERQRSTNPNQVVQIPTDGVVPEPLMSALVDEARESGKHTMVAAVHGANEASIRFHKRLGFVEVARMPETGAKFGRWLDLVLLQLRLDDRTAPRDDERTADHLTDTVSPDVLRAPETGLLVNRDARGSGQAPHARVRGNLDAAEQPEEGERMTRHGADVDRRSEWDELRSRHLASPEERPTSSARGVHHLALLSSDVERTIVFYQDLLEFPLTELFENRDYQGSTHFFFDIGNGNLLAFFDFPGLDLGDYAEVLGGLHHLAISVEHERWQHLKDKLDTAGVSYEQMSGSSLYFTGPDGERLELIRDPLGEMYGTAVL